MHATHLVELEVSILLISLYRPSDDKIIVCAEAADTVQESISTSIEDFLLTSQNKIGQIVSHFLKFPPDKLYCLYWLF